MEPLTITLITLSSILVGLPVILYTSTFYMTHHAENQVVEWNTNTTVRNDTTSIRAGVVNDSRAKKVTVM